MKQPLIKRQHDCPSFQDLWPGHKNRASLAFPVAALLGSQAQAGADGAPQAAGLMSRYY